MCLNLIKWLRIAGFCEHWDAIRYLR